jgi:PKD repeat protein
MSRAALTPVALVLGTVFSVQTLAAPPAPAVPTRMYGAGAPFTIEELPPGQLRERLQALPPQARQRAMSWLHSFSFPAQDVEQLRVDDEGGVFYVDPGAPEAAEGDTVQSAPAATAEALTATDVFRLHSRPGATKVVHVDFDGAVVSGTAWNSSANISSWNAKPYDLDGAPGSFNATEIARIHEIWHRIAEDYSGFDIDVTTEAPATRGPNTGWILVTHSDSGTASPLPSATAGGVAYVGVWGRSDYTSYQPAFVYFNNLAGGSASAVAEAASHELGHNRGLSHDGTLSGASYYSGHGSGYVSWAPIMGVGYYSNVTQWSKGEYPDANQTQDDIAIIAARLAYRPDDHANDAAPQATPLGADPAGQVLASNPETDPANTRPANKGVLESRTDVDVFAFSAGAGTVSLEVAPAWKAFYRTSNRGANADIRATLLDAAGNVLASSDPDTDTVASVSAAVQAGVHYLKVEGVGHPLNYSDYGSNGEYFVNGTVPPGGDDVTPPTPDPMQFAVAPASQAPDRITMSAVAASDASGVVEYQFACVSGGSGCTTGAWQSSTSYTATGLDANTSYSFTVQARDLAGNTTAPSAPAAANTQVPNSPPTADFTASCIYLACSFTDASLDLGGTIASRQWSFGDGGSATTQNPSHSFAAAGIYNVSLTVTDDRGATASTVKTVTVYAPPAPAMPDGLTASDGGNGSAGLAWMDQSNNETGFELQRETQQKGGSWRGTTTVALPIAGDGATGSENWTDTPGAGTHRYRIRAANGSSYSAWTTWTQVTVTSTGSGGCKGTRCR